MLLSKHLGTIACMDTHRMDVPAFIRTERMRKGWSQRELARAIGVTHGLVGQWEAGSTPVTPERLLDLCAVFEIAPGALFADGAPFAGRLIQDPAELALITGWRRLGREQRNAVRVVLCGLGFSIPPEIDDPQARQRP